MIVGARASLFSPCSHFIGGMSGTPMSLFHQTVRADFEGSTPPYRTNVTYHEVDGRRFLDGKSGSRSFVFGLPTRSSVIGQRGAASGEIEWNQEIMLRLSTSGRSRATLADACANEVNLLMRTAEKRDSWPTGVLEVITEEAEPEEEGGSVIYTLRMRILTREVG